MKTLSALLFVPVEQVVVLELVDLAIQDGFHVAAFAVGPVVLDQTVRLEGVGADLAAEGDGVLARILGGALGFAAARLLMRACPKLAPTGEGRAEWAAPLVCWIVIIAASTISDLLILW